MVDLRHLRTLTALVETGSLTAASVRLHLTQSALSHQIKELEERLGLALINRGARPLKLTYAGQMLVDLAGQILPRVDETLAGMNRLARGAAGRLYIAGECHSCLEWVLPLLARYREIFPGIELDVVLSASLDPLPRLLNGSLDVVLTPDRRELPGLSWHRLFDYELKLVVAADHALSQHSHVTPDDLRGETLLVYPVNRARLDIFTRFLWPASVEPARVRQAESTTLLLELAALAQGVAVLPDWACKTALHEGRISVLTLGSDVLFGSLWASIREAETELPHIKGFVDAAMQREDTVTTRRYEHTLGGYD